MKKAAKKTRNEYVSGVVKCTPATLWPVFEHQTLRETMSLHQVPQPAAIDFPSGEKATAGRVNFALVDKGEANLVTEVHGWSWSRFV